MAHAGRSTGGPLTATVTGHRPGRVRLGAASLCLVQFVDVLGVTVVVTALPAMLASLKASPESATLISTGYAMFFGGLLMVGARLGDRSGHRRIIFTGLAIFAVAAVVGATAGSVLVLTAARCLQGAAAALSVPSALRLLTTITSDGPQRQRAVAAWSASGAAAGASGFVVGGVATSVVGWRAVFWAYLIVAALLAAAIGRSVPPDRAVDRSVRLNLPSMATFTGAVMAFVVATTLLAQPGRAAAGVTLAMAAVALSGCFVVVDRRSAAPLLPTALLHDRSVRHGAAGALLNTLTTSSAITLTTLYLQNTRRHSPLAAGLMLLPFSLAVIAGSALAVPASVRWPPQRLISAGLTVIAVADSGLIAAANSNWALPIVVTLGGTGLGLSSVASTRLGTRVPVPLRGTASGVINTAAQLGTAVGIAMLLLVAALSTGVPGPGTPVPLVGWAVTALVSGTGAVIYALMPPAHPQA